jgi:hypothetical protein
VVVLAFLVHTGRYSVRSQLAHQIVRCPDLPEHQHGSHPTSRGPMIPQGQRGDGSISVLIFGNLDLGTDNPRGKRRIAPASREHLGRLSYGIASSTVGSMTNIEQSIDKIRENRVRRAAERQRFSLRKSRRRDLNAYDFNGYMLINPETNSVVLGGHPYDYSATLDHVEEYLRTWRGQPEV